MITALGLLALFVLSSRNSRDSQECVVRVSVPDEQLLVGRDGLRREEKRGRAINTWISVYFIIATLLRFIITVLLFYCKYLILSFKLVINSETFSEFLFFFSSVQIYLNFSCMSLTFEHQNRRSGGLRSDTWRSRSKNGAWNQAELHRSRIHFREQVTAACWSFPCFLHVDLESSQKLFRTWWSDVE